MLTASDIQNKEFSKTRSAGYSIEEVNEFLDEVSATFVRMTEEKNILSEKALALSDKLETIRDEQELWRKSIITTQKSFDEVIETAKKQAADIVASAVQEAERRKSAVSVEIVEIERQINELKEKKNGLSAEVESFRKTLLSAYEQHICLIRELPVMKHETVTPVTPVVPEPVAPVSTEPVSEEPKTDTDATIVIPKITVEKEAERTDSTADEEMFIPKIDTSRVTFEREEEAASEKSGKKLFGSDSENDEEDEKGFPSFERDEEENEEDDGDDEERESVLKNLFSGSLSSRKKQDKKKKSRFFVDEDDDDDDDDDNDEDEESDDVFDEEE